MSNLILYYAVNAGEEEDIYISNDNASWIVGILMCFHNGPH